MRSRFTILPLLLCVLPGCPSGGGDAPAPPPTGAPSVSLQGGNPGALGGMPGNGGLGTLPGGNDAPGAGAPGGVPPVPAAPGNAPAPGGPAAAQPASPGAAGYGKAK